MRVGIASKTTPSSASAAATCAVTRLQHAASPETRIPGLEQRTSDLECGTVEQVPIDRSLRLRGFLTSRNRNISSSRNRIDQFVRRERRPQTDRGIRTSPRNLSPIQVENREVGATIQSVADAFNLLPFQQPVKPRASRLPRGSPQIARTLASAGSYMTGAYCRIRIVLSVAINRHTPALSERYTPLAPGHLRAPHLQCSARRLR